MTGPKPIVERLRETGKPPSAYAFVGDRLNDLFDPELRHRRGIKPVEYLKQWLSMLRPFAYATQDDSWGELEKLICIVMSNYVRMQRNSSEAADHITSLEADNARMREAIRTARARFYEYADNHSVKGTAEGNAKAERNIEMAEILSAALSPRGES